jgi:hypothetical protein
MLITQVYPTVYSSMPTASKYIDRNNHNKSNSVHNTQSTFA